MSAMADDRPTTVERQRRQFGSSSRANSPVTMMANDTKWPSCCRVDTPALDNLVEEITLGLYSRGNTRPFAVSLA